MEGWTAQMKETEELTSECVLTNRIGVYRTNTAVSNTPKIVMCIGVLETASPPVLWQWVQKGAFVRLFSWLSSGNMFICLYDILKRLWVMGDTLLQECTHVSWTSMRKECRCCCCDLFPFKIIMVQVTRLYTIYYAISFLRMVSSTVRKSG